jgi:hypothetical protein
MQAFLVDHGGTMKEFFQNLAMVAAVAAIIVAVVWLIIS